MVFSNALELLERDHEQRSGFPDFFRPCLDAQQICLKSFAGKDPLFCSHTMHQSRVVIKRCCKYECLLRKMLERTKGNFIPIAIHAYIFSEKTSNFRVEPPDHFSFTQIFAKCMSATREPTEHAQCVKMPKSAYAIVLCGLSLQTCNKVL